MIDEMIQNYRTMWGVPKETPIQSAFIQEMQMLKSRIIKEMK